MHTALHRPTAGNAEAGKPLGCAKRCGEDRRKPSPGAINTAPPPDHQRQMSSRGGPSASVVSGCMAASCSHSTCASTTELTDRISAGRSRPNRAASRQRRHDAPTPPLHGRRGPDFTAGPPEPAGYRRRKPYCRSYVRRLLHAMPPPRPQARKEANRGWSTEGSLAASPRPPESTGAIKRRALDTSRWA